jgi:protein kinase C substrate 80K-H
VGHSALVHWSPPPDKYVPALYSSLQQHALALKSLRAEHERALAAQTQLEDILAGLRTAYNPNYQDMAVLAAVRDYEAHAKLPHINDVRSGADEDAEDEAEGTPAAIEDAGDGLWSSDELEEKIDGVLGADYESLLLEHDKHVGTPDTAESICGYFYASMCKRKVLMNGQCSTLPTIFRTLSSPSTRLFDRQFLDGSAPRRHPLPTTTKVCSSSDRVLSRLDIFLALTRARANLAEGERALADAQRTHDDAARDLRELFSPARFGAQGEWKKLDKTCLEHNAGEYTYEICMFDEARQKPNKGGQTFSLGCAFNLSVKRGETDECVAKSLLGLEHSRTGG